VRIGKKNFNGALKKGRHLLKQAASEFLQRTIAVFSTKLVEFFE
jgi:hypothetical protein